MNDRLMFDTNVLVAATVCSHPHHALTHGTLLEHLNARKPWCLTWSVIYEFLRVTTHPKVFSRPLPFQVALKTVTNLLYHPFLEVLQETPRHHEVVGELALVAGSVSGNFIHDCHIAALMVENDVHRIVTFDTHFRRFPQLKVAVPGQ
jgi:uncharacterized protein